MEISKNMEKIEQWSICSYYKRYRPNYMKCKILKFIEYLYLLRIIGTIDRYRGIYHICTNLSKLELIF